MASYSDIQQQTNLMRQRATEGLIQSPQDFARIILQSSEVMSRNKDRQRQDEENKRREQDSGIYSSLVQKRAGGALTRQDIAEALGRIKTFQGNTAVAGLLMKLEQEEEDDLQAQKLSQEYGLPYLKGLKPAEIISMKIRKDEMDKENARVQGLKNLAAALEEPFMQGDTEDSIRARASLKVDAILQGRNPVDIPPEEIAKLPRGDQIKVWAAKRMAEKDRLMNLDRENKIASAAAKATAIKALDDAGLDVEMIRKVETGGDEAVYRLKTQRMKQIQDLQAGTDEDTWKKSLDLMRRGDADVRRLLGVKASNIRELNNALEMNGFVDPIFGNPSVEAFKKALKRAEDAAVGSEGGILGFGAREPVPVPDTLKQVDSLIKSVETENDDINKKLKEIISKGTPSVPQSSETPAPPGAEKPKEGAAVPQTPKVDFASAYADLAKSMSIDPDPKNPMHAYNYEAAFNKYGPTFGQKDGHLPSEFKEAWHPNRFVLEDGKWMDTKNDRAATLDDVVQAGKIAKEQGNDQAVEAFRKVYFELKGK